LNAGKNKALAYQAGVLFSRESKQTSQEVAYCLAYFKANLLLSRRNYLTLSGPEDS